MVPNFRTVTSEGFQTVLKPIQDGSIITDDNIENGFMNENIWILNEYCNVGNILVKHCHWFKQGRIGAK